MAQAQQKVESTLFETLKVNWMIWSGTHHGRRRHSLPFRLSLLFSFLFYYYGWTSVFLPVDRRVFGLGVSLN